jgi:hypothetical protein
VVTAAKYNMITVWSQVFIYMGCNFVSFASHITTELMDVVVHPAC